MLMITCIILFRISWLQFSLCSKLMHALIAKLFPINQCEIGKTLLVVLAKQLDIGLIVRSPAFYNSIR